MENNVQLIKLPCVNKAELELSLKDVVYIKSDEKICILFYLDSGIVKSKYINLLLGELAALFNLPLFFRCHKSFIVNIDYVKHYGGYPGSNLHLTIDANIPLSRRKKLAFHNAYRYLKTSNKP